MKSNNILLILFIGFVLNINMRAQEAEPNRKGIHPVNVNYFQKPLPLAEDILLTNEKNTRLYLFNEDLKEPVLLISDSISIKDFSVSPDKINIGIIFSDKNKKTPGSYNILNHKLNVYDIKLFGDTKVSYANNTLCCFSHDTIYIIKIDTIDLIKSNYSINNLQLSPDGQTVLFSDNTGNLFSVNLDNKQTNKIKTEDFVSNFSWSPDGQKIALSDGLNISILIPDSNIFYHLGQGGNFNWSDNSRYIVFQRTQPIKMKFVNSDIFISSYKNTVSYQITHTNNIFEMQPAFSEENTIYYSTYEDRAIYKMTLYKFKIKDNQLLLTTGKK